MGGWMGREGGWVDGQGWGGGGGGGGRRGLCADLLRLKLDAAAAMLLGEYGAEVEVREDVRAWRGWLRVRAGVGLGLGLGLGLELGLRLGLGFGLGLGEGSGSGSGSGQGQGQG